jgi:hypothetical protein
MGIRFTSVIALCALMVACGDGTGPSDDGTGRYRLDYMTGAQPPWRYVDGGGAIGDDVDSVMLRMTHAQEFSIIFYLHVSTLTPTWHGTWTLDGSTLQFVPTARGSSPTSGVLDGSKLTINEVSRIMPGIVFPNGYQTAFEFKLVGGVE